MSAMGCVAGPKPVTLVVSDVPCVPVLLPVPGSSRTSEASPGPLPHKRGGTCPLHGLSRERTCIAVSPSKPVAY
ncbi:hypothetical protein F4W70_05610 [Pseudomonas cannabina]|nr:hypothetical protein F4W70_05610 [Pseudomonas cannabina]